MSKDLTYSIVIPALNLSASIQILLRCLEAQSFSRDRFECIFVNDGSIDDTRQMLDSYVPGFRMRAIHHVLNCGRSEARNAGIAVSSGSVLVFLDGDMLPSPDWLASYDQLFTAGGFDVLSGRRCCISADPKGANLAERLSTIAKTNVSDLFRSGVASHFKALALASRLGQYPDHAFETFERDLRSVCSESPNDVLCAYAFVSSNVAVRRETAVRTKGFDVFLRRVHDTELGFRLWESGARFGFSEGAVAYHQYDAAQPDRGLDYSECIAFFQRHPYRRVVEIFDRFLNQTGAGAVRDVTELGSASGMADCRYGKSQLAKYFYDTWRVDPAFTAELLDDALNRGLYTELIKGQISFDANHAANWLRYKTPFQQELFRSSSYGRDNKTPVQLSPASAKRRKVVYRGRYELTICDCALPAGSRVHFRHIPLPIECFEQTNVRIYDCCPPDLLSNISLDGQRIAGCDQIVDASCNIRLGYSFECAVQEIKGPYSSAEPGSEVAYLRLLLPAKRLGRVKSLLKKIVSPRDGVLLTARKIYDWVLDNTAQYAGSQAIDAIGDTGIGSCISVSTLFINLCRMAHIPARERCGALLLRTVGSANSQTVESTTVMFSPFAHTWAEIMIGSEWLPVEFVGWAYGPRMLTARNVTDPGLRTEIENSKELYDNYYFGGLDPYRIHCGPSANKNAVSVQSEIADPAFTRRLHEQLNHRIFLSFSSSDEASVVTERSGPKYAPTESSSSK